MSTFFLLLILVAITNCVEIWNIWETSVVGPSSGNPFKEIEVSITLISPSKNKITLDGFYDGNGIYRFRYMPNELGQYSYFTNSNNPYVEDKTGSFKVTNATGNNRGPVYAINNVNISNERPYFIYANDAGLYFESGTTSYAWIQLPSQYKSETVNSLKYVVNNNIFNKLRMTIFPTWDIYTHYEPQSFVFTGSKQNNWNNFTEFNLTFWSMLDADLNTLQNEVNIIIDLIIFHPYDGGHWGFDCIGGQNSETYNVSADLFYLKYLVARVAAYRNVWWSMANEYDQIRCKNTNIPHNYSIWDTYFEKLIEYDPYNNPSKEKSIHQGKIMYNYSREWTTHFSIQGHQNIDYKYYYKKFNVTKALILDEVQYEGNLSETHWGNLSGIEEVDRFWEGMSVGMQMGHSESLLPNSIHNESDTSITWWNYGNKLRGESYKKIQFYNQFMTNYSIHPPFHKLFTHCYVQSIYNSFNSDFKNITGCYISQLYDPILSSYYLIRWTNYTNTDSLYGNNTIYNTTININIKDGTYSMYQIDEWNEKIILLNDNIVINGNKGYIVSAKVLPQTIQFINKQSQFFFSA